MNHSEDYSGHPRARGRLLSVVEQGVYVTHHAVDRLRLHHPNVGIRGTLALLTKAEEVEPGFIAPFLARSLAGVGDRYFISACRRGVFVVVPGRQGGSFPWALVTYLRFGSYQRDVAEQLLGAP